MLPVTMSDVRLMLAWWLSQCRKVTKTSKSRSQFVGSGQTVFAKMTTLLVVVSIVFALCVTR